MFTICIGSVLVFFISKSLPYDTIETNLNHVGVTKEKSENYHKEYDRLYRKEKLDLPLFYFSIIPDYYKADIHVITDPVLKAKIREAQREGYNGDSLWMKPDFAIKYIDQKQTFHFPEFNWHGKENQYHYFIKNFLTLNLGTSNKDGKFIIDKIKPAMNWTFAIILWSILLSIPIAVLWSLYICANPKSFSAKFFKLISSIIPSIPSFWLATIVLIFFTGYSYNMPLFYTPLYSDINDQSLFNVLFHGFRKISPIVFCMMLTDITYLTRLFTFNIEDELKKPYVLALKAKGYRDFYILRKHVFRNILLPFITVATNSLPVAFAGTVIYEVVFNVNGIGRLLHVSIQQADWKIVYCIAMFILILTVFIYQIGDYLYGKADPRINMDKV